VQRRLRRVLLEHVPTLVVDALRAFGAAVAVLKDSVLGADNVGVPAVMVPPSAGQRGGAGLRVRALPFVLIALAGVGPLALTDLQRPGALWAAGAVTAVILVCALLVPWRRLPPGARDVPPLAFFLVLVLLREAGGGSGSGVGPLALLPVCWLAMYGGRTGLRVSLLAMAAVFLAPLLLDGGA
jgi:hypothetical protein